VFDFYTVRRYDSILHHVFGRAGYIRQQGIGRSRKQGRAGNTGSSVWPAQTAARPMHFAVNGSAVIMRAGSANKGSLRSSRRRPWPRMDRVIVRGHPGAAGPPDCGAATRLASRRFLGVTETTETTLPGLKICSFNFAMRRHRRRRRLQRQSDSCPPAAPPAQIFGAWLACPPPDSAAPAV
jgi:hypothetical protein